MEKVIHSGIQGVFSKVGVGRVVIGGLVSMVDYNKSAKVVEIVGVGDNAGKVLIIAGPVNSKEGGVRTS
jgi:hypothetical protein